MRRRDFMVRAQERRSDVRRRIGDFIHRYEEQGFHRTGTEVDQISGEDLANHVRDIGLEPMRAHFGEGGQ